VHTNISVKMSSFQRVDLGDGQHPADWPCTYIHVVSHANSQLCCCRCPQTVASAFFDHLPSTTGFSVAFSCCCTAHAAVLGQAT
jgi:hypothetical protein